MDHHLGWAAVAAAMVMGGCVAYPVDGYRDRGDVRVYRAPDRYDGRYGHDERGDWRRDRDRDRDRDRTDRDGNWRNDRP